MPPRKKIKPVEALKIVVSGEEKLVPFGWCMTGHHDGCVVSFTGHRCSCKCHGGTIDAGGEVSDE